jgi:hypothetical protein
MKEIRFYSLKSYKIQGIKSFVEEWKQFYTDLNPEIYKTKINLKTFSQNDVELLFIWKNGMPLKNSGTKEIALKTKILSKIDKINEFKNSRKIDIDAFNLEFDDVSAVWRIFLLHIIKPKKYPIYDQHIHRTYCFIHGSEWKQINNNMSNKLKLEFYFNSYLPFVSKLGVPNLKSLDEAFFAFGQFINTKHNKLFF